MVRQEQAAAYIVPIREHMKAELEAINAYQKHIETSDIIELNEIWQSIIEDEKRHYGMLLEFLRRVDPEQEVQFEKVKNQNAKVYEKIQIMPPIVRKNRLEILSNVRNDIWQELQTINNYEGLLSKMMMTPIEKLIRKIGQDEKEHMEQLTKVILELDTDDYGPLKY